MTGLTSEEKELALTCASNGADFMFIPSPHLCNLLIVGSPSTIDVNKTLVAILLTRKPIRLDTSTVVKYCIGTLDHRNAWLLDNGDIEVVSPKHKKVEITKAMAEDDDWNWNGADIFHNDLKDNEHD